jgi:hypothetical protein
MWFDPGYGYHVDSTTGIATGNEPESIYAVMCGARGRFNGGCCFDYGNSEINDKDDGAGAMEAIYFGTFSNPHFGNFTGAGHGPWVGADMENGIFYGGGNVTAHNKHNTPLTHDFVSVSLKGGTDSFSLKGGDATQGTFKTMYSGPRPTPWPAAGPHPGGYQPMRKQGAIILATGGDQSNQAKGNFYEGFMAKGYATDAVDADVQANIVAVGYSTLA